MSCSQQTPSNYHDTRKERIENGGGFQHPQHYEEILKSP